MSQEVKALLREKGIKVTTQRVLVLSVLMSNPEKHFTAEEIYELVKSSYPEIGLATVYRTIQLLSENQLVDRISLDDGFARYEIGNMGDATKHHHHHLICRRCGKVLSFRDDLLEELEAKILSTTGFYAVNHEVKLYGYCQECGGKSCENESR